MSGYFGDKEPAEFKRRSQIAIGLCIAAFFILSVRLWYLQVKESDYYSGLSLNNSVRLIKAVAPRGVIYDRTGAKIADNRPGYELLIVPEDVKDMEATKALLKRLVGIDGDELDEKIAGDKKRPRFQAIKLKEELTWDETVKIESYKFEMPGVILDVAPKRHYLYNGAFAHLIGYIGEVNEKELKDSAVNEKYALHDNIGKYGLERSHEGELKGLDGGKSIEVDAHGRKIRVVNWTAPYPGSSMRLTVDLNTQLAAVNALKDRAGAAIALEPSSGRILAMVSSPSFDPNGLSTGLSKDEWNALIENPFDILNNRAIQGLYPPASTFKPIHASAALEEKTITPETRIYSGPAFRFAGRDYRDWKEEGHGTINVHRAIVESSDTFFYQVGLKLGVDTLAKYSRLFGFGAKTGINLANEKNGIVPSSAWKSKVYGAKWFDGETISVSVGQGYMLATPLQLANAYAAIANGGTLYVPQAVEEIITRTGTVVKSFTPQVLSRLDISKPTLERVREALHGVTHEDGGTARFLSAVNLGIAGKTGTAQVTKLIARTKNIQSIPYKFRDHAWFAGFAPYDDPKIVVVVIVEHGGFGASSAAPVAREIFKAYLGASPDGSGKMMEPRVVEAAVNPDADEAAYD